MKSLKEIQEEYAMDKHHVAWVNLVGFYIIQADTENLFKAIDDTSRLFAMQVAGEALKKAYNKTIGLHSKTTSHLFSNAILNVTNIPEL